MKRRQFTQFFTLLGSSLTLPAFARDRSVLNMLTADSNAEPLSRSYFEASLGQTFHIAGGETRTLVLKSTEDACGEHCCEQFHATFEVSPGKRLNDGIFRLGRGHFDHFDLFLTESVDGNGRQRLIATINRQTHI